MCLTPSSYNSRTGLGWFCPLTRQVKGYPFEVILQLSEASDDSSHLSGVILADHLTSADWRARQARYAAKVSAGCLQQVVEHILRLLPAVTSAETDQEAGQSLSGRTAEHNNEDA